MIKSDDYLKLFGNIIDRKAENNIKFFNLLCAGMNLYEKYYEKVLLSDVIDYLENKALDIYALQFNLRRNGLTDIEFRKLIKSFFLLRTTGTDMNSIINAIANFLEIEKIRVHIFDKNNDETMEHRHIRIMIFNTTDMQKVINFLRQIKAAGIIIDCWEMLIKSPNFEYNTIEYDNEFYTSSESIYTIDCKGEIKIYKTSSEIEYEYNKQEYDLNELTDIRN